MINLNKQLEYKNWIIFIILENKKNLLNQTSINIEYIAKKKKDCLIERGSMYKQKQILINLKNKIDLFENY